MYRNYFDLFKDTLRKLLSEKGEDKIIYAKVFTYFLY